MCPEKAWLPADHSHSHTHRSLTQDEPRQKQGKRDMDVQRGRPIVSAVAADDGVDRQAERNEYSNNRCRCQGIVNLKVCLWAHFRVGRCS